MLFKQVYSMSKPTCFKNNALSLTFSCISAPELLGMNTKDLFSEREEVLDIAPQVGFVLLLVFHSAFNIKLVYCVYQEPTMVKLIQLDC